MGTVQNFMALFTIIEVDKIFYLSLQNESLKKKFNDDIQEELLKVVRTTSNKAFDIVPQNQLETDDLFIDDDYFEDKERKEDGIVKPTNIRVDFLKERKFFNKMGYLLYKILRLFNIVIWQYFAPFYMLITCFFYIP